MRKWQLVGALSIGIMASGSGFIQAQAADYVFFVNFDNKQVDNFNDFTQTFLDTTFSLGNKITFTVNLYYRMAICPDPTDPTDVNFQFAYRLNGLSPTLVGEITELPDMECNETNTFYQIVVEDELPNEYLIYLINDDENFIEFRPNLRFRNSSSMSGRQIIITDAQFVYTLSYEFDTTYLFNYFLSDTDYNTYGSRYLTGTPIITNDFDYVMTTAGNDRYFIINSSSTDYGIGRNKFAVDYNMEYFRGESIGARYSTTFDEFTITIDASLDAFIQPYYRYYYLNAANNSQPIVDVPEFNFEYEDCGSFLALNVGCFINNGLAYITNDAPIISDAITLLNAGMKLAGQAFGVIGSFSDNNVFGVLILGGLGLIAVRWFLKND